jgi:poly(A) polymerase
MTEAAAGAALDVPTLAKELGERFSAAGHELYLVGGTVRDLLLGRPSGDWDFATSAHPTETTRVLRGWADRQYLVGVKFGTVGALKDGERYEITTYREEVYAEEHRKPAVTFGKDVTTDLSRRDFSINAMAVRLPDAAFLDPFGGVKALAARVLDTPLDPEVSFGDDPLRMIRAARFVAQLGVTPAPRIPQAIEAMASRLEIVAAERIREELDKLLVSQHAASGLAFLVETGLADLMMPEVPALRLEQDPVHRHKDVLRHTYAVVDATEPRLRLRLAALLHDIGKPRTRQVTSEGVTFHHHEVVGARMARERLVALRYPNTVVDDVCRLIELHLRFHGYGEGWTDSAVRRYVRDAGELLDDLNQLTRADVTTRDARKAERFRQMQDQLEERIAALAEEENLDAMRPPLDGRQVMELLGVPAGPAVGEALAFLMEVRMERGPVSEEEASLGGCARALAGRDPCRAEQAIEGGGIAAPVCTNRAHTGAPHQVSKDQCGDDRVVERPHHRQELGQQVDRRDQPDAREDEPHLRPSRHRRVPDEIAEEQDEVREQHRKLAGLDAASGHHERQQQARVEDDDDEHRDQPAGHRGQRRLPA